MTNREGNSVTEPAHSSADKEIVRPNNGRVTGWMTVVVGVAVAVGVAFNLSADTAVVGALGITLAVLGWASSLRPAMWLTADEIVLRNMVTTTHIPLAAVLAVSVRNLTLIEVATKRFRSPVLVRRRHRPSMVGLGRVEDFKEPTDRPHLVLLEDFLDNVAQRTEAARTRAGIRLASAEQEALAGSVRRTVDVVPLVAVLVVVVLLVVTATML